MAIILIMGPSGAGKTTMVQNLRALANTSGHPLNQRGVNIVDSDEDIADGFGPDSRWIFIQQTNNGNNEQAVQAARRNERQFLTRTFRDPSVIALGPGMSGHNELTEFIRRHQAIVLALTLNDLQVADERLMNRLANGPIAIASSPNYGSWHADILVRFDADRNSFESISDRGVRLVAIRNGIMTEAANRVSRVNDAIPRRERAGRSREFESESMFEDAERFVIQAV